MRLRLPVHGSCTKAFAVNVGGAAFSVTRIGGRDWGISLIVGMLSWPIAVLVRLIPTEPVERWMIKCRLYPDPNKLPEVAPAAEEAQWNEGITKVIDNLSVFNQIKGGRARSSSIVRKSRYSKALEEHDIHPSSLMAMVPALVATSLGGGWRPDQVRALYSSGRRCLRLHRVARSRTRLASTPRGHRLRSTCLASRFTPTPTSRIR